jgi:hypothetical protein
MTDLTTRPTVRTEPVGSAASGWLSGLAAAAAAAGMGLLSVTVFALLAWVADARSGSGLAGALRAAAQIWLAAHGATIAVPGGQVRLMPLGLTALVAVLLGRAGASVAQVAPPGTPRQFAERVAMVALPYAGITTVIAAVATSATVRPAPLPAALGALLLAGLAVGYGVATTTGTRVAELSPERMPGPVRAVLRGAVGGVGVVVAGGALLAAVALGGQLIRTASTAASLGPGWIGGLTLLMFQIALVPTAAIWGAACLVGPGFALGSGTSVSMFSVSVPAVPALPMLAAVPGNGDPPEALRLLVLVPVVAGMVAGILADRPGRPGRPAAAALTGAAAGVAAAILLVVGAVLAGGSAGPGKLATVGPSPWRVGLAAAVEIGVPAAIMAWWRCYRRLRPDAGPMSQLRQWRGFRRRAD